MKATFLVTVYFDRIDEQPIKEFSKEDARAFIPYLKEKLKDATEGAWQYNASTTKAVVTKFKKQ